MQVNSLHIDHIRELPTPTTAKEVRSFCGALQYYNSMYPGLNVKLAPLHRGSAVKEFEMTSEKSHHLNFLNSLVSCYG